MILAATGPQARRHPAIDSTEAAAPPEVVLRKPRIASREAGPDTAVA